MTDDDRRRVERVTFSDPPAAHLGDQPARLIDLGLLGARLRHERPIDVGAELIVRFTQEGEVVRVVGKVTRCEFQQVLSEARGERIYISAVEFVSADPLSSALVKRLIAEHVARALEAQKANARGAIAALTAEVPFLRDSGRPGKVARATPTTFVSCRPGPKGTWRKTIVARPVQPVDGFTVRLGDTEEEVDRLCQAWSEATPEIRRLIRLCAEISTLDDEDSLPPQRFNP